MKIAIGNDHAGVYLKNKIMERFSGVEFINCGTDSNESVDYPDIAEKVCSNIINKKADLAIVICGTGIGISIASNKIKGIRCALCFNEFMAEMSRKHNNANVLALGARVVGEELCFSIIERFLKTDFEGGRHERRVCKINDLEG